MIICPLRNLPRAPDVLSRSFELDVLRSLATKPAARRFFVSRYEFASRSHDIALYVQSRTVLPIAHERLDLCRQVKSSRILSSLTISSFKFEYLPKSNKYQ